MEEEGQKKGSKKDWGKDRQNKWSKGERRSEERQIYEVGARQT